MAIPRYLEARNGCEVIVLAVTPVCAGSILRCMDVEVLTKHLDQIWSAQRALDAVVVVGTDRVQVGEDMDRSPYGTAPVTIGPVYEEVIITKPDEPRRSEARRALQTFCDDTSECPLVRFLAGEALGLPAEELKELQLHLSALSVGDLTAIIDNPRMDGSWRVALLGRTQELPDRVLLKALDWKEVSSAFNREILQELNRRAAILTYDVVWGVLTQQARTCHTEAVPLLLERLTAEHLLDLARRVDTSALLKQAVLRLLNNRCAERRSEQPQVLATDLLDYPAAAGELPHLLGRLTTAALLEAVEKQYWRDSICFRELSVRLRVMPLSEVVTLVTITRYYGDLRALICDEVFQRLPALTVSELRSIDWYTALRLWSYHLYCDCSTFARRLPELDLSEVERLYAKADCKVVVRAARAALLRHSIVRYAVCFARRLFSLHH